MGQSHTLLLTHNGELYSMGDNKHGSLGWSTTSLSQRLMNMYLTRAGLGKQVDRSSEPVLVEALRGHKIVQVAAGSDHSLALCEDGHVFSWGLTAAGNVRVQHASKGILCKSHSALSLLPLFSSSGRLGHGDHPSIVHEYIPQLVLGIRGRPLSVAAGLQHSLVLTAPTLEIPSTCGLASLRKCQSAAEIEAANCQAVCSSRDTSSPVDTSNEHDLSPVSSGDVESELEGDLAAASGVGIESLRRGVRKVARGLLPLRRRSSLPGNTIPPPGKSGGGDGNKATRHLSEDDHQHHQYSAQLVASQPLPLIYQPPPSVSPPPAARLNVPEQNLASPARLSESEPDQLDPGVESLLRQLNYHEDECVVRLFVDCKISYEALKTFSKADLAEMGLPFGPRTAIFNILQASSGNGMEIGL